ncbi:MAG: IS1634 family transposase [Saprospiraceae bacterium]
MEEIENITTKNIDHLGIVSGVCEEIGLVKLIDKLTESDEQRKVSVGTASKAMILNGLGFANRTLYLTPVFFKDKAVDVLLGAKIKAEDLDSHCLGTALDAIYKAGISKVFYNVSLQSIKRYGIKIKSRHLDGTTFMVHGDKYKDGGEKIGQIELKRGYNKQKRNDLRQFVFEMISSNVEGIPLFIKAASGNKTDKTEFPEVLEAYMKQMQESEEKLEGYVVADSALYGEENLDRIASIQWISRVPETIKQAKEELKYSKNRSWKKFEAAPGYEYEEVSSSYGGITQRWLIIKSSAAAIRSKKTVEKKVAKESIVLKKGIKTLKKVNYSTKQEAEQVVADWYNKTLKIKDKRYHNLGKIEVLKQLHYGRGRRKADAKPERIDYELKQVELTRNEQAIKEHIHEKSQFILATNETDSTKLGVDEWLHLYKNEQQKVERGFRFLKDPMFLLSHIFLELPRRIMALSMIMGLCLLVYTLAQYKLRKILKQTGETIPNQLGKPIQNPTTKWVFQLFSGIHVIYINGIKKGILNLDKIQLKILELMGAKIHSYYTV